MHLLYLPMHLCHRICVCNANPCLNRIPDGTGRDGIHMKMKKTSIHIELIKEKERINWDYNACSVSVCFPAMDGMKWMYRVEEIYKEITVTVSWIRIWCWNVNITDSYNFIFVPSFSSYVHMFQHWWVYRIHSHICVRMRIHLLID